MTQTGTADAFAVRHQSFGAQLGAYARSKPDEMAVMYPDLSLSWRDLDERSTNRAKQFRSRGVEPDDIVLIALPNGAAHHELSFATWKAGATPCIVPPKLPGRELSQIIALANPRLIVRQSTETSVGIQQLDPADPFTSCDTEPLPDLAPTSWKIVTSGGSSGRPKLIVEHAPGRFDSNIEDRLARMNMPKGGAILNPGPLYHNAPFLFTSLALFAGSKVVGMDRFDAEECLRLIERHSIEWMCVVPTMMHRIWKLPREIRERYDVSSLKTVWHMAAPCPPWLKRAWIEWLGPDAIFEAYSGTEASGTRITGREWLAKPGSVGRVTPGTLSIHGVDGEQCAPGDIGEIFFPPSARARFHYIGDELRCDPEGRFTLGDLGHTDEDGYLFLADRRTDLIIRGGANVYPAEVEAALEEHPAVAAAVVIGIPCEEYGQRVHAILEVDPTKGCVEDVHQHVRARVAGYKCPESYEIVSGPLRNDAGKVRRLALAEERRRWLLDGRVFQTSAGTGLGRSQNEDLGHA